MEETFGQLAKLFVIVLLAITAGAGFLLSVVYAITSAKIAANEKAEVIKSLEVVFMNDGREPFAEKCSLKPVESDKADAPWTATIHRDGESEPVGKIVAVGKDANDKDNVWRVYRIADDKTETTVGWIGKGEASGYSGAIPVILGVLAVDPSPESWTVRGLKVLKTSETPGLGENIHAVPPVNTWAGKLTGAKDKEKRRPVFQRNAAGVPYPFLVDPKVSEKDICGATTIDAMSGATITSHAAIRAMKDAAKNVDALADPE